MAVYALRCGPQQELLWPWWGVTAFAAALLLASSQLAMAIVNWLVTQFVAPEPLPRMDYSFGIASASRTLVVVPTMLGSAAGVEALVEALEVRFLANRDPNLHFGLLTDLHDAASEHLPGDAALVELAAARIEALNARYRPAGDARGTTAFYLFHRPRRWNEVEQLWMGYERKRGKLTEFNALLRGGSRDCFSAMVGNPSVLPGIKFVITLDTDTQLPRETARQLVGTISHPLNRPRFDPVRGIVTEGYSILQPRVGVSLPSAGRSWFVKLFAGDVGIDPYTRRFRTFIRTCSRKALSSGKGFTMWTRFNKPCGAVSRKTRC